MPELPEVETIKNTLKRFVLSKTIKEVFVYWPNIIKKPDDVKQFAHLLAGQTIRNIKRKGKFLLFYLDDHVLVSHLRMEGKYRFNNKKDPIEKHTHVIFQFTDDDELRYNDVRKFGTMHLFPMGKEYLENPLSKLAPDPFDERFTLNYFIKKLQKTNRVIKAVLLDQTVVSGLGNIYVDEVLFQARIHPKRKANTITEKEAKLIKKYAILTLENAVQLGGSTIRSYVNGEGEMGMFQQELYVYAQEDKPCKLCSSTIIKLKVAGRGTHICPRCQVEEK